MVYRTDKSQKLQRSLERLADEEAELEQVAKDLEACSKYKTAEVRLKTKGLSLIKQEDYEEAKKYVDTLLKQTAKAAEERKQKRKKVISIAKATAVAAVTLGLVTVVGYKVIEPWWNKAEYALEALAKYDTPAKYMNLEVREEIISKLDDIIKEHAYYIGSDNAAEEYLRDLEAKGYSVDEGAKALDKIGQHHNGYAFELTDNAMEYLDYFADQKLEPAEENCLFNLAKTMNNYHLMKNVKSFHTEGYCK